MKMFSAFVSGGVILFSLLAALAWIKAATASVAAKGREDVPFQMVISDGVGDRPGTNPLSLTFDGKDMLATVAAQTRWNRLAAFFAAAAAVFQLVGALLP